MNIKNTLAFLLAVCFGCSAFAQFKNYRYEFKIKGASDTIFLANYLGKQLYYNDTAVANAKGTFVFQSNREIKPGKFAIVQPGKMYFELLINEPQFTFIGDTANLIGGMKIENSLENELFYSYIQLINNKKAEIQPLSEKYSSATTDEEKQKLKDQIAALNKEVGDFQKKIVAEHPNSLVGQIINMSLEIEIPEAPKLENGKIDSTFSYYYYRDHFWDNTNLRNDALVRDPSFVKKLETYFDKVVLQHPDTLSAYADKLIAKMDDSREMFKITVNWLINHYSKTKIMGLDAVYVHMAENYYVNGKAFWADSATVAKLEERVKALSPTLVGKKAPQVILYDTAGTKRIGLYSVESPYTILYFWDSTCGHCKKATPKLKKIYEELHPFGVEVFAVGGELETESWKKYIREKELPWINVSDTPDKIYDDFRNTYDIYAYPKVYLLDKDKKILVKGVGVEQLGEILLDKLGKTGEIDFGFKPEEEAH